MQICRSLCQFKGKKKKKKMAFCKPEIKQATAPFTPADWGQKQVFEHLWAVKKSNSSILNEKKANSWFPSKKSKRQSLESHYTAHSVIMWHFIAELSSIQMGGNLRSSVISVSLGCLRCSFMRVCHQIHSGPTLVNTVITVKPRNKQHSTLCRPSMHRIIKGACLPPHTWGCHCCLFPGNISVRWKYTVFAFCGDLMYQDTQIGPPEVDTFAWGQHMEGLYCSQIAVTLTVWHQ